MSKILSVTFYVTTADGSAPLAKLGWSKDTGWVYTNGQDWLKRVLKTSIPDGEEQVDSSTPEDFLNALQSRYNGMYLRADKPQETEYNEKTSTSLPRAEEE